MSKYEQQAKATKKKRTYSNLEQPGAPIKRTIKLGKAKPLSDDQKTLRQQKLRRLAITDKLLQLLAKKKGKK